MTGGTHKADAELRPILRRTRTEPRREGSRELTRHPHSCEHLKCSFWFTTLPVAAPWLAAAPSPRLPVALIATVCPATAMRFIPCSTMDLAFQGSVQRLSSGPLTSHRNRLLRDPSNPASSAGSRSGDGVCCSVCCGTLSRLRNPSMCPAPRFSSSAHGLPMCVTHTHNKACIILNEYCVMLR